jgi:hypothetical protein
MRHAPWNISTLLCLVPALAASCGQAPSTYQPYGAPFPSDDANLGRKIAAARAANTPEQAVLLWKQVVERYPDGEQSCDDAIDLKYFRGACLELSRALYLCGSREEGDRWAKQYLDDLLRVD